MTAPATRTVSKAPLARKSVPAQGNKVSHALASSNLPLHNVSAEKMKASLAQIHKGAAFQGPITPKKKPVFVPPPPKREKSGKQPDQDQSKHVQDQSKHSDVGKSHSAADTHGKPDEKADAHADAGKSGKKGDAPSPGNKSATQTSIGKPSKKTPKGAAKVVPKAPPKSSPFLGGLLSSVGSKIVGAAKDTVKGLATTVGGEIKEQVTGLTKEYVGALQDKLTEKVAGVVKDVSDKATGAINQELNKANHALGLGNIQIPKGNLPGIPGGGDPDTAPAEEAPPEPAITDTTGDPIAGDPSTEASATAPTGNPAGGTTAVPGGSTSSQPTTTDGPSNPSGNATSGAVDPSTTDAQPQDPSTSTTGGTGTDAASKSSAGPAPTTQGVEPTAPEDKVLPKYGDTVTFETNLKSPISVRSNDGTDVITTKYYHNQGNVLSHATGKTIAVDIFIAKELIKEVEDSTDLEVEGFSVNHGDPHASGSIDEKVSFGLHPTGELFLVLGPEEAQLLEGSLVPTAKMQELEAQLAGETDSLAPSKIVDYVEQIVESRGEPLKKFGETGEVPSMDANQFQDYLVAERGYISKQIGTQTDAKSLLKILQVGG